MNDQTTLRKPKEIIIPVVDTERINQLASAVDAKKAAESYAAGSFAGANTGLEEAKAQAEAATARRNTKQAQLSRVEAQLETMAPTASWVGNQTIAPMSLTQRVLNGVGIVFVIVDPLTTMYATASYLTSSGLIENMADSIWEALPFCLIFPLGIMGLKALHDCLPSENTCNLFRLGLLGIGVLTFFGFGFCYAYCFNLASAALPDAGNPGAGGGRLSLLFAVMLVLLQVITTASLGAGITLMLIRSIDKNKAVESAPCHDYVTTSDQIHELEVKLSDLTAVISVNNDYISRYNAARDGFISMVVGRVLSTRDFIDAKSRLTKHKIQRRLSEGSIDHTV